ncbi:MAG: LacI family transcriptional regulator [Spirochaetaceae bacterium]|nr:MAG: LacI family transcriptional regulator [Spirochaetaceae bacterium]
MSTSKGRITIREIAAAAGVSTSAVSYVLNNRKGVSDETRSRVQDVIQHYGYQPNINSLRLVSRRSFNIRIAIQNRSSPFHDFFFHEIARGVLEGSAQAGYNIVFCNLNNTASSEDFFHGIDRADTDGIIFFLDVDAVLINRVRQEQIPAVVIDGHDTRSDIVQVLADYRVAAAKATETLIAHGHRHICLTGNNLVKGYFNQVFAGFRDAIGRAGISVPVEWVLSDNDNEDDARSSMLKLLQSGVRPTGVVCASDILAVGVIQAVKSYGLSVPGDISVVGIDDIVLSRYIEPALTTVRIDKVRMGRIAVNLLLHLIGGSSAESVVVPSDDLILRDSVRSI